MGYDTIFGTLVIATWVNSVLLMIESLEVLKCLSARKPVRTPGMRCLVLGCYVVDLACSAADCASVYLYTVVHWGDEEYMLHQNWPIVVEVASTGIVAFCVQLFLILRFYSLSHSITVSAGLVLTALLSAGGAFGTAGMVSTYPSYVQRNHVTPPLLVWLFSTAIADTAIAAALVWELRRMQAMHTSRRADGMIRRLISMAIKTGGITSAIATVTLICYLSDPEGNIPTSLGFILGRTYTITMLYNINHRGGLSSSGSDSNELTLTTNAIAERHLAQRDRFASYGENDAGVISTAMVSSQAETRLTLPFDGTGPIASKYLDYPVDECV